MTNLVMLSGYLGKKPELKTFESGSVCNATLADTEVWKDRNGERKEKTNWFNLVLRNALAENFCKYFDKGSGVEIVGKLSTRKYEQNGEARHVTEIIVDRWEFPKGKGTGENQGATTPNNPAPQSYESAGFADELDSEIPF